MPTALEIIFLQMVSTWFSQSKKVADQKLSKRIKSWLVVATSEALTNLKEDENLTKKQLFGNILLTLVEPQVEAHYFAILQLACKNIDYGMALYYVEALFKDGFKDVKKIEALEGTALLRIMPEYQELIDTYITKGKPESD